MSEDSNIVEKIGIMIMEKEASIGGAEHQKQVIRLRIAKRRIEIKRDEEHILLQDKEIEKAKVEIGRLNTLKKKEEDSNGN